MVYSRVGVCCVNQSTKHTMPHEYDVTHFTLSLPPYTIHSAPKNQKLLYFRLIAPTGFMRHEEEYSNRFSSQRFSASGFYVLPNKSWLRKKLCQLYVPLSTSPPTPHFFQSCFWKNSEFVSRGNARNMNMLET